MANVNDLAPVVYRSIPTSNRNVTLQGTANSKLYIVLFLHQTATKDELAKFADGCISFYSYIKPQQTIKAFFGERVVYRSIPTSNRNKDAIQILLKQVVYRSIPTSNRN